MGLALRLTDNTGLQTRRRWHELLAPVQFMISRNWNIIKEGHKEERRQQTYIYNLCEHTDKVHLVRRVK